MQKLPLRWLMPLHLPSLRAVLADGHQLLCSAAMAAPHAVRVKLLKAGKVLVSAVNLAGTATTPCVEQAEHKNYALMQHCH